MDGKAVVYYMISDVAFKVASNATSYFIGKWVNRPAGHPEAIRSFGIDPSSFHIGKSGIIVVVAKEAVRKVYDGKTYTQLMQPVQVDAKSIPKDQIAMLQQKPPFESDPKTELRTMIARIDSIQNTYLKSLVFYAIHSSSRKWEDICNRVPFGALPPLQSIADQADHPLLRAWGAVFYHHAYSGGWLIHTNEVLESAIQLLLTHFGQGKYPKSDMQNLRDQVIAGAILHDLGKLFENEENLLGWAQKSIVGELHGGDLEITLRAVEAISDIMRRETSIKIDMEAHEILMHTLSAHHGQYGPSIPRTLPAAIVQMADKASSSLAKMRELVLSGGGDTLFLEGKPFFDIRTHFSKSRV